MRRDFHNNPGNMYCTRLIVAGLSLVQFCRNWKSPWSTRSEVVKTAWDQVKMHEKLWAIRLWLERCATNNLHSWNHVKDLAAMCLLKRISAMICLNTGLYSDCCGWIILIFMLGWHGLFWFGLGPLFGTLCLAVFRCSGSKWWTTWYVCCEKEGG